MAKLKHVAGTSKVEDLIPYARNPRKHSAEAVNKVVASIREFGFTNPVIIDEAGMLLAGHRRKLASIKMGLKEVPHIQIFGLTEAQKKALIIADNRLAEDSDWDDEMLAGLLHDLNAEGFNLELTGFESDELEEFLRPSDDDDSELTDGEGDEDEPGKEYLTFGDNRVPITAGEIGRLAKALNRYVDKSGAPYSFVAYLLDGAGE
ncbi:ParB/Srx family N-terminal domain-containing protein [Mesorhizobium sp. Cs1299R1N3]|uniref:ParB/Srx family N-terminal domain-containing protein n=1 Tax=Mesorhizobium sp. Cs1299R1N3 TaxID=3015173 RepID=UPI00301C1F28